MQEVRIQKDRLVFLLLRKYALPNRLCHGREDKKAEDDTTVQIAQGSGEERPLAIIQALGGRDNLVDVDNCATRLRVTVKDGEMVNEAALQQTGSKGVIVKGEGVQVIYGPQVSVIKNEIEEELEK